MGTSPSNKDASAAFMGFQRQPTLDYDQMRRLNVSGLLAR